MIFSLKTCTLLIKLYTSLFPDFQQQPELLTCKLWVRFLNSRGTSVVWFVSQSAGLGLKLHFELDLTPFYITNFTYYRPPLHPASYIRTTLSIPYGRAREPHL